jgi:hypothetical protein
VGGVSGVGVGVMSQTERVLGLVNDAASAGSVNGVVLRATELVHGGLGVGLGVVGLGLAGDLVGSAGQRLLDLGAC